MYKSNGISYYAPGIHFRAGLAMKYTLPERDKKKKELDNMIINIRLIVKFGI